MDGGTNKVRTIGVIAPKQVSDDLKLDAQQMVEAFKVVHEGDTCRAIILADTAITHVVREACERNGMASWMIQPDSDKHIPQTTIINIIEKSDYVYLCFDGEDNAIIFALGECLEREKPFRIVQDKPTSPKHVIVDAMMRGLLKQAEEQMHLGAKATLKAERRNDFSSLEFGGT
jgi:hypothetical protein